MKAARVLSLMTVGVATWVAAMATGQIVVLLTNIPASSAVLTGFLVPFLLVLGARALPGRAAVTIAFTTYGVLSIPFLLLGPPGVHKIAVALIAGVVADLVIAVLPSRLGHWVWVFAFSVWAALLAGLAWVLFQIIELPGKEAFEKAFPVLTVIFVVTAAAGSLAASIMFQNMHLAERPLIRRLRGGH